MGTPAFAVYIIRKITKDKTPLNFSLNAWKKKKICLFSITTPGATVFIGGILFYVIFPNDLDYNGTYISQTYGAFGAPSELNFNIASFLLMGVIVFLISALCVPSWFIASGEDIGWQGYLLPLLRKKFPVRYAVLLNGTLWGMGHAPLIYFRMNYGLGYTGAPFTGMAMMIFVWMSYVTIKTNNCMYAALIHGSINIIGEAPVFILLSTQSPLLSPNPSGIISMLALFIGAVIFLWKLLKSKLQAYDN